VSYDIHFKAQGSLNMLQVLIHLLFSDTEDLGQISGSILPLFQQLGNALAYCQSVLLSKLTEESMCFHMSNMTSLLCYGQRSLTRIRKSIRIESIHWHLRDRTLKWDFSTVCKKASLRDRNLLILMNRVLLRPYFSLRRFCREVFHKLRMP
jgi:hypothetical protein